MWISAPSFYVFTETKSLVFRNTIFLLFAAFGSTPYFISVSVSIQIPQLVFSAKESDKPPFIVVEYLSVFVLIFWRCYTRKYIIKSPLTQCYRFALSD